MTLSTDLQAAEKRLQVVLTGHHIVLYVALAVALLAGVYLIESKLASLSEAKAEAAQTALAVEKDHSAQLAAAYATAQAQRDKENAQFLATIQQIQSQTKVQIVHDQQLPAPELGHRIEDLTGFKQGTVTLNSNQDLIVPLPLAQNIVARIDQGVADAQTVQQQAGVIANQTKTINDQTEIIQEDKIVLAKQIDTDAKVLNAEKAKARKSKLKYFGAGVVLGFIGRHLVGF